MAKHIVVTTNVSFRRLIEVPSDATESDVQEIARKKVITGNWTKWLRINKDFTVVPFDNIANGKKLVIKAVNFESPTLSGRRSNKK